MGPDPRCLSWPGLTPQVGLARLEALDQIVRNSGRPEFRWHLAWGRSAFLTGIAVTSPAMTGALARADRRDGWIKVDRYSEAIRKIQASRALRIFFRILCPHSPSRAYIRAVSIHEGRVARRVRRGIGIGSRGRGS